MFEDLKTRNEFDYLNELYADLFINFVYDKELRHELYKIFIQQDEGTKNKFSIMFDAIYLNFKKMNEDEGSDDLEDDENPYKLIEVFQSQLNS